MTDKIELKPCPHCGSNYKIAQESNDTPYVGGKFYLYHEYGELWTPARRCRASFDGFFDSEEQAARAWNTRTDAAKDAEIKRLREALEPFAASERGLEITVAHLNRARAALSPIPDPAGGMPVEVET